MTFPLTFQELYPCGVTISFIYAGGSRPGTRRQATVLEYVDLKNGQGVRAASFDTEYQDMIVIKNYYIELIQDVYSVEKDSGTVSLTNCLLESNGQANEES